MTQAPTPPRSRWSFQIARVAGIEVNLHATLLILLLWIGGAEFAREGNGRAALLAVAFISAIFACVVLHELGHALAARHYGIGTRSITLYPMGGIAQLEKMPSEPRQEFVIALAGPLVNVAIAFVLLIGFAATAQLDLLAATGPLAGAFLARLFFANLFLAAFNLLPAFPMDGGRVLRALLAARLGRERATRVAAQVGQGMAVLFAIGGLFLSPMLLLIAVFVWIGAGHEANAVELGRAISGMDVSRAMETAFASLVSTDSLEHARALVMAGQQIDFPVLSPSGQLVGLLDREALAAGIGTFGLQAAVASVMRVEFATAEAHEPLTTTLERLSATPWRCAPVLDPSGRVVGLLSSENIGELVMFDRALAQNRALEQNRAAGAPRIA